MNMKKSRADRSSSSSRCHPESGVFSMRTTLKDPGVCNSALYKLKNTLGMQKKNRSDTDITSLYYRQQKVTGDNKSQTEHSWPRSRPSCSSRSPEEEEVQKKPRSYGTLAPVQVCISASITSPPRNEKMTALVRSCSSPCRKKGKVYFPAQVCDTSEKTRSTNCQISQIKTGVDLDLLSLRSKQDSVKSKVWSWLESIPADANGLEENDMSMIMELQKNSSSGISTLKSEVPSSK